MKAENDFRDARGVTSSRVESLGERFIKSDAMRAFRSDNPEGNYGSSAINVVAKNLSNKNKITKSPDDGLVVADDKVITTAIAGSDNTVRLQGLDNPFLGRPNTILNLIQQGTTELTSVDYRQIIADNSKASIVPEAKSTTGKTIADGYKPVSDFTTEIVTAKAHTYADGFEVTNQELSDDGLIAAAINSLGVKHLLDTVERYIVSGKGGVEEPLGILNTKGVRNQDFDKDVFTTLRKAKATLETYAGVVPQAVLLNPEDNADIDLSTNATGSFYAGGPFAANANVIWGVPRVVSPFIPKGTAIIGDFSGLQLLLRENITVAAYNQHEDFARRNMTYIRAEFRALNLFRNPSHVVVAKISK